jgi:hypothetical protein
MAANDSPTLHNAPSGSFRDTANRLASTVGRGCVDWATLPLDQTCIGLPAPTASSQRLSPATQTQAIANPATSGTVGIPLTPPRPLAKWRKEVPTT